MSAEKSTAIVLRVIDFSESSCVVTLFTRDFGKISALAKGARRPKSSFEAALDLLAICRVVFLHKSSDALDLLTEAKLQRRFRAGGRELRRLYAGYYVAELLDKLTDEADPHPDLFDLAEEVIGGIDGSAEVAPTVLRFELQALKLLGHLPSLRECVECGVAVSDVDTVGKASERVSFGMLAGGILCRTCRPGKKGVVSVSREAIELLRQAAAGATFVELGKSAASGEARSVINNYLSHLLGNRPRLQPYLNAIM